MNWSDFIKPALTWAGGVAMAHVAARYHLTGDQVTAIMADLGTAAAAIYALKQHNDAALMQPPKEK